MHVFSSTLSLQQVDCLELRHINQAKIHFALLLSLISCHLYVTVMNVKTAKFNDKCVLQDLTLNYKTTQGNRNNLPGFGLLTLYILAAVLVDTINI